MLAKLTLYHRCRTAFCALHVPEAKTEGNSRQKVSPTPCTDAESFLPRCSTTRFSTSSAQISKSGARRRLSRCSIHDDGEIEMCLILSPANTSTIGKELRLPLSEPTDPEKESPER